MMDEKNKTRKSNTLLWLGGLIMIGLVFMVAQYLYWQYKANHDASKPNNNGVMGLKQKISLAVDDFVSWADSLPDKKMNVDHELTSKGLKKIAKILTLLTDSSIHSNNTAHADIAAINVMADSVTQKWKSGKHADMIKKAFTETVEVIATVPYKSTPKLEEEIITLKRNIANIDVKTLNLNQRDDIKESFKQTAIVFRMLK